MQKQYPKFVLKSQMTFNKFAVYLLQSAYFHIVFSSQQCSVEGEAVLCPAVDVNRTCRCASSGACVAVGACMCSLPMRTRACVYFELSQLLCGPFFVA